MAPRSHLALAALFAIVVPVASWLEGSGLLAYRMYARSASYRLRVTTSDELGRSQPVSPTALAASVRGGARPYLAGAEHWRTLPRAELIGAHVAQLARLACGAAPLAGRARVDVELRRSFDGPVETTSATAACR
jgi:hypothetical protein